MVVCLGIDIGRRFQWVDCNHRWCRLVDDHGYVHAQRHHELQHHSGYGIAHRGKGNADVYLVGRDGNLWRRKRVHRFAERGNHGCDGYVDVFFGRNLRRDDHQRCIRLWQRWVVGHHCNVHAEQHHQLRLGWHGNDDRHGRQGHADTRRIVGDEQNLRSCGILSDQPDCATQWCQRGWYVDVCVGNCRHGNGFGWHHHHSGCGHVDHHRNIQPHRHRQLQQCNHNRTADGGSGDTDVHVVERDRDVRRNQFHDCSANRRNDLGYG